MDLTGAALRRSLPSALPAVARGSRRRPRPSRVACARGGFAEEGHLRYYEAGAARKAVEQRSLARIRAVGLVAGDAAVEKEATDLLLSQPQELNKTKEYNMKKAARKEEKAAMKALKKQQQKEAKKAAAVTMCCEDGSSSESSESDCEDEKAMKIGQGVVMMPAQASEVGPATSVSTVYDKDAMKAAKKMEKEQKKAAKKAMKKMKKEAKKMAIMNGCRDEDSLSSSSESSESECEGEVLRMSRCATIVAPQQPAPSMVFPIIVPQLPESMPPQPLQQPHQISSESPAASATQCTTSVAVLEKPMANRIEVCMGGKCKKSGSLALLQEFEKKVGTGGAVVGCKCLGKCGLGPNVRLRSEGSAGDGSVNKNPLCIGVGLEDVGTIVTGLFRDGDLGMTPA